MSPWVISRQGGCRPPAEWGHPREKVMIPGAQGIYRQQPRAGAHRLHRAAPHNLMNRRVIGLRPVTPGRTANVTLLPSSPYGFASVVRPARPLLLPQVSGIFPSPSVF